MNIIKKLIDYIYSSKNELSKVTWPSKEETIRYSTLVIIISLGAIAFFGVLDYGLNKLVNATLSNVKVTNQDTPQTTNTPPVQHIDITTTTNNNSNNITTTNSSTKK